MPWLRLPLLRKGRKTTHPLPLPPSSSHPFIYGVCLFCGGAPSLLIIYFDMYFNIFHFQHLYRYFYPLFSHIKKICARITFSQQKKRWIRELLSQKHIHLHSTNICTNVFYATYIKNGSNVIRVRPMPMPHYDFYYMKENYSSYCQQMKYIILVVEKSAMRHNKLCLLCNYIRRVYTNIQYIALSTLPTLLISIIQSTMARIILRGNCINHNV